MKEKPAPKGELVVPEPSRTRREDEGNALSIPPVQSDVSQIMTLIAQASRDRDFDPEKMVKLYELRDREINRVARMEFVEAMAKFKENPPKIVKDKRVFYPSKSGGAATEFWHATLGNVVSEVIDGLARVGISHDWKIKYEGDLIYVTCILTHKGGHAERTEFPPISPDASGSKNSIQAKASAITYAQRYSLLAATGLAAADDDDGRGAGPPIEYVNEQEVADLEALISEHGGNKVKLLRYLKLDTLADVPAANFKAVCDLVREFAAQKQAKGGRK